MGQQRVSSDPGSAYLKGLTAELECAMAAELAWGRSLEQLENGRQTWQDAFTEVGDYNAARYSTALVRVTEELALARERVQAAHRAIIDQQEENLRDYRERLEKGFV